MDKKKIRDLVSKMTLEEKAYQIIMVGIPFKESPYNYIKKEFQQGIPGSVVLFKKNLKNTPLETKYYIDEIQNTFSSVATE